MRGRKPAIASDRGSQVADGSRMLRRETRPQHTFSSRVADQRPALPRSDGPRVIPPETEQLKRPTVVPLGLVQTRTEDKSLWAPPSGTPGADRFRPRTPFPVFPKHFDSMDRGGTKTTVPGSLIPSPTSISIVTTFCSPKRSTRSPTVIPGSNAWQVSSRAN